MALGVGAAVATSLGAGTARADDTGSAGASTASDSATSTPDRSRRTGAESVKRPADKPRVSTRTTAQTGERVSRDSKVTSTTSRAARVSAASAVKPRTTAISARTVSAPKRVTVAGQTPAPQAQPAATITSDARSTLDTDSVSAPELSRATPSVEVAEAVAAPSPSTAAGDTAPAESPALWALLAWTRRASTENIQTDGAVAPAAVTTSETTDVPEDTVVKDIVVKDTEAVGNTGVVENTTVNGDVTGVGNTGVNEFIGSSALGQTITVSLGPDTNGEFTFDTRDVLPTALGLFSLQVLVAPSHGAVTVSNDGMVTYKADPKYTGEDTFTVGYDALGLGLGLVVAVDFEVFVTSANQVPWGSSHTYLMVAGTSLTGNLLQYSHGGDGPLTVSLHSQPGSGSVVLGVDGTFVYTPHAGFAGTDIFSYTVTDIDGDSAIGKVTIQVQGNAPLAADDTATVTAGDKVTIDVLKNDQHSGGELKIELVDKPAHGSVEYDATTRTFTYTAGPNQTQGSDTFTYSIIDAHGQSTATVTIQIAGKPPLATDDTATVTAGDKVTIDVLKNDQYSGGELKIELVGQPTYGKVEYDPSTRTFTYIAGANQTQDSDTFTYSITDGNGHTSTATVKVAILVKPTGPTANDDWATTPNTSPVTIDVLANDDAPGEKPPTVRIDSPPRSGKVELLDGKLVYTPDPGFVGSVSIGYSITDPSGVTSAATVTVTVTGKEYAEHHYTVTQGATLRIPGFEGLLSDPRYQGWTVSMAQGSGRGTVALHPDGTFSYTPEPGFLGEDSFIVYVSDGKTETKMNVYINVVEAPTESEPQPVVQPVGFTSSALALGGGRTTAECTDYYWPEIVDPDTVWPTCTLLYVRDDFNQVR